MHMKNSKSTKFYYTEKSKDTLSEKMFVAKNTCVCRILKTVKIQRIGNVFPPDLNRKDSIY